MAEVKVDISGRSPVKPNGAKKKTVTFVASSKKFKVTAKPPSTLDLSYTTDDVTSQSGPFDIDNEDIVSSLLRSSSPSLKTRDVDLVVDTSDIANDVTATDPEERKDQDEPKTAKSLTDVSSCDHQFSVRVRRASSQTSGTKPSPAVLKARCVRRRLNRFVCLFVCSSSQPSGTKPSPAVLRARCVRRRINRFVCLFVCLFVCYAVSQASGTKLGPAVLKARCVRRRINSLRHQAGSCRAEGQVCPPENQQI
uniref:Uncharacterized protein n=1 Tax=Branchiostoma floridae TaxID=7739 RepID=C3YNV0_BRAFL|eukprot:XP_002602048.1 hypothetical protein BRAFLDRAFT_94451 [Branchiostoma floridae]